jgi:hypothetical protein
MTELFQWCAWIGGTILAGQTILALIGAGVDHGDAVLDASLASAGDHPFLGALSFRALVAFTTFFGLAGLAAEQGGATPGTTMVLALAAGVTAFVLIAQAMRWVARLQSSGTLEPRRAIGAAARVYLRIPKAGEGAGRVHVDVQGRRIEARAVSSGPEFQTGALARVIDVAPDGALVVAPH